MSTLADGMATGTGTASAAARRGASMGGMLRSLSVRRVAYGAGTLVFGGALYRGTLSGRAPRGIGFIPEDPWPGESARGAAIMRGEFRFAGSTILDPSPLWRHPGASLSWQAELHGFSWLRDLHAVGGDGPRAHARRMIMDWIETNGRWQPLAWRPDVLGARIANWLANAEFLTGGAETEFLDMMLESLGRQTRHLRRVATLADVGLERLLTLKGMIYSALCLAEERKRLDRWLTALADEVDAQVLSDGGHVERSPAILLATLRQLIALRAALRDAQVEVPPALQNAIDRMAPVVRFFRHGDGGLSLFNGTNEEESWQIDVVLNLAEAGGKPPESIPHSGFERLGANRTVLLMDVGAAISGFERHAHAGTLSFEMSVGKERLIVNCGSYAGANEGWHAAQRATAAHSTLTVENTNSTELLASGTMGHRPTQVMTERQQTEGNTWIDATHDGYTRLFGLIHRRRLFMAANGGDLRGEDVLSGSGHHKFALRFHLHPGVTASVVQGGASVLMRLPSGAGWRFRAEGGVTNLQDSVYLGVKGEPKRCAQIVVSGASQDGDARIKWKFTRVDKKAAEKKRG